MQPRAIATILLTISTVFIILLTLQGFLIVRNILGGTIDEGTNQLENTMRSADCSPRSTFCKAGKDSDCVAPFHPFMSKYRTAPRYNLTACVIEKSMSTVLTGIICYLYDSVGFKTANRSIANDPYENRFCMKKNEYSVLQETEGERDYNLLTVVRDPIDRFISGFTDKCVLENLKWTGSRCYGCEGNFTCFVEKQYARMMGYSRKGRGVTYEDIHFNPQTWYCSFRQRYSSFYIVKYKRGRRMTEEILKVLRIVGVEEKHLRVIKEGILNDKTPHSTKLTTDRKILEKQIRSNPYVMGLLLKMFYYDFVFFGFDLPVLPSE